MVLTNARPSIGCVNPHRSSEAVEGLVLLPFTGWTRVTGLAPRQFTLYRPYILRNHTTRKSRIQICTIVDPTFI